MSLKYEYKYMYISDLLTFHIIIAVPDVVLNTYRLLCVDYSSSSLKGMDTILRQNVDDIIL
jgi:hypothetical protein